jgi:hypothetical protein
LREGLRGKEFDQTGSFELLKFFAESSRAHGNFPREVFVGDQSQSARVRVPFEGRQ